MDHTMKIFRCESLEECKGRNDNVYMKLKTAESRNEIEGRSALHLAAARGNVCCCEVLLSNGASPRLQDLISRATPLHIAETLDHLFDFFHTTFVLFDFVPLTNLAYSGFWP
ncbi:hypothetical protein HELRODRAFT_176125 [Helobdella robusta]|uniref:Uncharacterized protein n=1 Tax=Helobdella robusta TaxID=6412 RepID=T1FA62_HELRO|nr:hypothetical protein HELRODRAFT_176125 [Helobdella robusta]ESO00266.1 hypothetical protein HELRODRAFT_176125 [Helobdella robusta]